MIRSVCFLVVGLLVLMLTPVVAIAASECSPWAAKLASLQGQVEVKSSGSQVWGTGVLDDTYCPGDTIRVGTNSRAAVVLPNETLLRLDQNTVITLIAVKPEAESLLDLLSGIVNFISRVPRSLKVNTPYVNAAIEGTEFVLAVKEKQADITVFEGTVLAQNPQGEIRLTSGESATAVEGQAPVKVIVVRPRDAVQWALYYPPVIDPYHPDASMDGATDAVRKSLQLFSQGDVPGALASLDEVPNGFRDSHYYSYRSSLLLYVGRVDEAEVHINQALAQNPTDANAMTLQSIIALVRNDIERALQLATDATMAQPDLAAPYIALSYAQQARFDLDNALIDVQKATALEPENALAWVRIAELELAHGRNQRAVAAAEKATDLSPNLARTQWILGFAYLSQISLKLAIPAFERAITLDSADPMARLGLGLAKIRQNHVKEGRRDIEVSAMLDPNSSIIRSYLGKAYYEEKRDGLAGDQYAMAKELDPEDPTPWFYDAIRKQSMNRPGEALQDLQKSIELNDNRAVYRSSLLLDDDLAARSASIGNIYRDLGFDQLAINQAGNTINSNPDNFSAHRLLSDAYLARPRHEFARVSELFQSQMLQPININPLQPQAGETSLTLLDSLGPANTALNEYNSLFSRNRLRLNLNALRASQDTKSYEGILSGIYNNVSASAGGYHYVTDGYHENNGIEQDLRDLFIQGSITHDTSLFFEASSDDLKQGDAYRFNPDNFLRDRSIEDNIDRRRIGLRHTFSPSSILLATAATEQRDRIQEETIFFGKLGIDQDFDSTVGELRYLYQGDRFNFSAGLGVLDSSAHIRTDLGVFTLEDRRGKLKEHDIYAYTNFQATQRLNLIIGLSGSSSDDDTISETALELDEVNPKFGLTWQAGENTAVRAAYIETFRRTFLGGKTLEPTNVAGFNQFYNDKPGAKVKKYAFALDHTFLNNFYGGIEFSKRDIDISVLVDNAPGTVREIPWEEKHVNLYLYWLPSNRISIDAGLAYEEFDRDDVDPIDSDFRHLRTYSIPIGLNLFHSSGVTTKMQLRYIDQEGEFRDIVSNNFPSGKDEDDFLVFDMGLQYRLKKRRGIVSVGIKNLFDQSFRYQEVDENNPRIAPDRTLVGQFSLLF